MVGVEYTFLIASYSLSCWVNYGFHFLVPANDSWRGPFYVQIGLASVLFLISFILPETPRWLANNGLFDECLQTVADLHAGGHIEDEHVQRVFLEIKEAVSYEHTLGLTTWKVCYPPPPAGYL